MCQCLLEVWCHLAHIVDTVGLAGLFYQINENYIHITFYFKTLRIFKSLMVSSTFKAEEMKTAKSCLLDAGRI